MMSSHVLIPGRSQGVLLSRLLWPTGILFAATLGILFSTILWTSDSINEVAAERQRVQLGNAIDGSLAGYGRALAELAAAENLFGLAPAEMAERLLPVTKHAKRHAEFATLLLVTRDWQLLAGVNGSQPLMVPAVELVRPLVAEVAEAAFRLRTFGSMPEEAGGRSHEAIARLMSDDQGPYAALALNLGSAVGAGESGAPLLLAIKRLDQVALGSIATQIGLDRFRLERWTSGTGASSLPIPGPDGKAGLVMTWAPEKPGDLMRERLVPLATTGFLLTLILFGFVLMYLRWITKDLAQSQARSQELLGRDPLSGLANRLLFGQRLDQALIALPQSDDGLAVLFIDLDRFKDVNDTYGHKAGDDLIQLVAQRLVNVIRGTDMLARFGGDEFAIIQTGLRSTADAETLAKRILDALTQPFAISDTQVIVGASIGIALAPEHGTGRESLMRLADTALYQAKSEGRNRYSFFQARMDETIRMRKTVEDDLRRAINENELVLDYQPLFSSDGEKIVGLEALVRWPHPTRGLINPSEFIAIAEERGLIVPLGEWVLRRACEDCKRWPTIRIAVNVSPIQFRHRNFVETVVRVLEETRFDPTRLELELTEGVVVEDADAAEEAMMELRALGVHLALDDFGTGYSSLIYLRRFAFDKIKIDRSFLESMEATGESAILVHSIVHLGRALGLTVTAEGVETKEQHRFLQALGCHQLQGFLFSKPVPRQEIDRMLGIVDEVAA
jgi:diguanylate cyclase (GGDEF)-like protein